LLVSFLLTSCCSLLFRDGSGMSAVAGLPSVVNTHSDLATRTSVINYFMLILLGRNVSGMSAVAGIPSVVNIMLLVAFP
jgi:hypothetical protein